MQICEIKSDMTTEKAWDILLKNECRQIKKNSNKALNTTALAYCNCDY